MSTQNDEIETVPHQWYTLEHLFGEVALRRSIDQFFETLDEIDRAFQSEMREKGIIDALISYSSIARSIDSERGAKAAITTPMYTSELKLIPVPYIKSGQNYCPAGEDNAEMEIKFELMLTSPLDIIGEPVFDMFVMQKYGYALLLQSAEHSDNKDLYASLAFAERMPTAQEVRDSGVLEGIADLIGIDEEKSLKKFQTDEADLPFIVFYNEFQRFRHEQVDPLSRYLASSYRDIHPKPYDFSSGPKLLVPPNYDAIKDLQIMLVDVEKPKVELTQLL